MSNKESFKSNSWLFLLFVLISFSLPLIRCQKFVPPENDTQISKHGDDESHYFGQNCMNCHYTEGRGEGWFSIAGSISGNHSSGMIKVYSDTSLAAIDSIEVDALGNFFTTNEFNFTEGLFFSTIDSTGVELTMTDKIFNGQCNLCHGVTQAPLTF